MNETAAPSAPLYPPQPLPRRSGTGLKIYAVLITIFLVGSVMANLLMLLFVVALASGGATSKTNLREIIVGGDRGAEDKIAVIDVVGVVSGWGHTEGLVGQVKRRLRAAVDDPKVHAIVLRIDSPGGEVTASDTLYQELRNTRQKKPVIAYINSLGASGAYYLSLGATKIICTETGMTGSIGVIAQSINFGGLMKEHGVEAYTFKSGKNKDLLNPFKVPTETEKAEQGAVMQAIIDEMYERFLGIVADERKLDKEMLRNGLADGRVITGLTALGAKLVDAVGSYEDAVELAKKTAAVTGPVKEVKYQEPFSFGDLFWMMESKANTPAVQVNLLPVDFKLAPGRLYFLSHHLGF
jgi:protease-4